jgi:hypothetical protein
MPCFPTFWVVLLAFGISGDMMNEYGSIFELTLNFLFWFLIGTIGAYIFYSIMEYIDGRK